MGRQCRGASRLALLVAAVASSAVWRRQSFQLPRDFAVLGRPSLALPTASDASPKLSFARSGVVATSASSASSSGLALVAAAVLLFGGLRRGGAAAPQNSPSRIVLHARNPFPTVPMGQKNRRRTRAGRKAFFRGRQIAVRVNRKTNKSILYRMHVKPGDTVQVMKGKDAGKVTTVLKVYPKWNRVLCLGVNFCIKHVRPQREDQVGQRVQVEAAMHASNVMHYSEKEGVVGNLGIKYEEVDGEMKKLRYNRATGEIIERKPAPEWVPVLDRVGSD